MNRASSFALIYFAAICATPALAQTRLFPIAKGWANNSVNTVVFRRNSVVSHGDTQYVAFYDNNRYVTLAKRRRGTGKWEIQKSRYQGNAHDAHNSISIMVDGDGYVHLSWDHHGHQLRYCQGIAPGSIELTDEMPMTRSKEEQVTYPEFYRLSNGNLLFLYRDGKSGAGNLIINHFDVDSRQWSQRQSPLIDGEGAQNAYWQLCTDDHGTVHLSWVWRETGDISTNHDIAYAKSTDEGISWKRSTDQVQPLPISVANAEYACKIPQEHELINTTSMCADSVGRPYIATYWRPKGTEVPQYHLVYHDGAGWQTQQITTRTTSFSLSGRGTKAIPISRPQVVVDNTGSVSKAYMVFRDEERGSRVSIAICNDLRKRDWRFDDLTDFSVGMWEPSYDTELWRQSKTLHLFVQRVAQLDGDEPFDFPPQTVAVLEWKPE